jgi:hypothetical protein
MSEPDAGHDVAVVDTEGRTVRPRALKRRLLLWLVGSAVGVLMVALPDDDRVFSISETHGPSLVDLFGIAVLIGAWVPIVALLWSQRRMLRRRERALAAAAALVGAVVLVVTIALDLGAAWVVGVALLLMAQLIVIRGSWASAEVERHPADGVSED